MSGTAYGTVVLHVAPRGRLLQADTGADLDFLPGSSGWEVSRESH